jgi:hypothetical protein
MKKIMHDKITITITLSVPKDFDGFSYWDREECVESLISHWLTEGYYANDHLVQFPHGIEYHDYDWKFTGEEIEAPFDEYDEDEEGLETIDNGEGRHAK